MKFNIHQWLVAFFVGLIPLWGMAGGEDQPVGARRIALGGAYTGVGGDFWALSSNPAALWGIQQATAGVHIERRFGVETLNFGTAGFALPFQSRHAMGVDFSGLGYGSYSESRIGLNYAFHLIEKLSLGVKVNYSRTSIVNYGQTGALFADIGLFSQLTKEIGLGFRVFNANQAKLDRDLGEEIPTTLALGGSWKPSEKVLITADAEKQVNYPLSWKSGVEYAFITHFRARAGFCSYPRLVTAGVGFTSGSLDIDFATSVHAQLGFSPHLSLNYKFGKKEGPQP